VVDALLRTTRFAGEDLDYLEQEVTRISGSIIRKQNDTVILDKATLLNLHPTLQRHLLRQAIESLLGNIKDIEARHIKAIIAALLKPAGRRFDLPGGLFFSIEYDRYLLGTDPQALSPFPPLDNEFVIKIPGETLIYGWRITATIIPRQQIPDKDDRFSACFDFDKTGDKISVRNRRSGDRFQPLGMTQTKKLGKFMIDTRIPQVWRLRVPVVTSSHHIIWIVGFRVDERTRVTAETNRVLYLEFERTADT